MSMEDLSVIEATDDHYKIPLDCLSLETFNALCSAMDSPSHKIIVCSSDGCSADVRGAIWALGYAGKEHSIVSEPSPMRSVLNLWSEDPEKARSYSVGSLIELLHELERFDVLYDLTGAIEADVKTWTARQAQVREREREEEKTGPLHISRTLRSLSIPEYDAAFSLDTNSVFAKSVREEIYDTLTAPPYNLRISRGIEELLPGDLRTDSFTLFTDDRWRRVIVLLTKRYLQSPILQQELHFSRVKGVREHERKVIPVEVEPGICLPDSLVGIVTVRYYITKDRRQHFENIYQAVKFDR